MAWQAAATPKEATGVLIGGLRSHRKHEIGNLPEQLDVVGCLVSRAYSLDNQPRNSVKRFLQEGLDAGLKDWGPE